MKGFILISIIIIVGCIANAILLDTDKTPELDTTEAIKIEGVLDTTTLGALYYWFIQGEIFLDDSVKITVEFDGKSRILNEGYDYTTEPLGIYIFERGYFGKAEFKVIIIRKESK